jgi:hypothetical protein
MRPVRPPCGHALPAHPWRTTSRHYPRTQTVRVTRPPIQPAPIPRGKGEWERDALRSDGPIETVCGEYPVVVLGAQPVGVGCLHVERPSGPHVTDRHSNRRLRAASRATEPALVRRSCLSSLVVRPSELAGSSLPRGHAARVTRISAPGSGTSQRSPAFPFRAWRSWVRPSAKRPTKDTRHANRTSQASAMGKPRVTLVHAVPGYGHEPDTTR